MGYGILRGQKIKLDGLKGMEIHVLRSRKSRSNPDIDSDKSKDNYDIIALHEGELNGKVARRIEDLPGQRTKTGKIRKIQDNAVRMYDFIVTGTHENIMQIDYNNYFLDALDFLQKKLGEKNIMYARVHMDERTPHMHVGVVPEYKGKLAAYQLFTPQSMRELQDEFWKQVSSQYGLKRGELVADESEDKPKRKHKTAIELKSETLAEVSQEKENLVKLKNDVAETELRQVETLRELEDLRVEAEKEKNRVTEIKALADAENIRLENLRVADAERQQEEKEQIQRLAELEINLKNLTVLADKEKLRANKNKKRADNAENKALEMEELTKNLTLLEMIKRDKIEQLEKEYNEMEGAVKSRLAELQVKENEQLQRLKDSELKEQLIKNRVAGLLEDNAKLSSANKRLNKEYEENFDLTTKSILKIKEAEVSEQKYNILQQEISSAEKELNHLNKKKEQAIKIIAPLKNEIIPALIAVDTAIRHKQNPETPVLRLWGATKSIINALPDYFRQDEIEKNANVTLHRLGEAELAETGDSRTSL